MVTFVQRSNIRDLPIAKGDVLLTRSLPPVRIFARRYAFQFGIPDATVWAPSTSERIVVDGLSIWFDGSSNRIRVGSGSDIATPTSFQLLLTLARAAPEVVPYEQLDRLTAAMNATSLDVEPWSTLYQRKRRLGKWLRQVEFPLKVVTVYNYGYRLRRST